MKEKIKWLMVVRLLVATALLGVGVLLLRAERLPFYVILSVTYLLTLIYILVFRWVRSLPLFAYLQIIGDIFLETAIIYFSGGIESTFAFLYVLSILSASIILLRRGSLVVTTLIALSYSTMVGLQHYGILPLPPYFELLAYTGSAFVFYLLSYQIIIFYLVSLLSGQLAEALLKEEKELNRLRIFTNDILQNVSSGILTVDTNEKITYLNSMAEKLLGIDAKTARGLSLKDVLGKEAGEKLGFGRLIVMSRKDVERELKIDRGGKRFIIGFSISLIQSEQGKTEGAIIIFKDLTDKNQLKEQLRRIDRVATMGKLATGIAHEIRNPLASLMGSIEILQEGLNLEGDNKNLFDVVVRESNRLNNLVNDFSEFVYGHLLNVRRLNINQIIDEVIILLKNNRSFSQRISIKKKTGGNHLYVRADDERIKQVFFNLGINALEAMTEGGALEIAVSPVQVQRSISHLKGYNRLNYVLVRFNDSGIGILPEEKEHIFDPFYSTKASGTGLGLAIAHQIVMQHEGALEVESSPGRGATFRVYLPRENINRSKKSGKRKNSRGR